MLTIKSNSENSVGLLSSNDLQNKYIQISSKSTFFFFVQPPGLQIHLGTSKQIIFLFLMDSNKLAKDHLWKRCPTRLWMLQAAYSDFGQKVENIQAKVGISHLFIDYLQPTNTSIREYLWDNIASQEQKKAYGCVIWICSQCIRIMPQNRIIES